MQQPKTAKTPIFWHFFAGPRGLRGWTVRILQNPVPSP
jgi:hypothetical protein